MSYPTLKVGFCRRALTLAAASLAIAFVFFSLAGPNVFRIAHAQTANSGTRLLRTPTVSATQIAFAYAQNIWVVSRAGGMARRVTSFQGQTSNPHFSPDGKWIAFSGEYAGNLDVYVVAADGGEPRRLTWHPGADTVQGWTPDGSAIMFSLRVRPGRRVAHPASGRCQPRVGSKNPCLCREVTRARFPRTDRRSLTA